MATSIISGENKHLVRQLLKADGTPLLRTAIASLSVELWQDDVRRASYAYNTDPEVSAGPGDEVGNAVQLEITTELSSSIPAGAITEIWQIELTDAAYVGGAHVSRIIVSDIVLK